MEYSVKTEEIRIGRNTIFAQTIPVREVYETWDGCNSSKTHKRFRLIEIDGYYLVSVEIFGENTVPSVTLKCFTLEEDGWSYLELFGIYQEKEDG